MRNRIFALALVLASLLMLIAAPASAADAPTGFDTCRDHGAYLGAGFHRINGGKNILVVEVCGDPVKRSVSRVGGSYLKIDGTRAEGLRLHWRWADPAGTVRGGGDDDRAAFALAPQNEAHFGWTYSRPVSAQDHTAPCVVGVLSQGMTDFITEPVCP